MMTILRMLTGAVALAVRPILSVLMRCRGPKTCETTPPPVQPKCEKPSFTSSDSSRLEIWNRAGKWLRDNNGGGISSRTIYHVLGGSIPEQRSLLNNTHWSRLDAPYDAADFGKCAGLLKSVPEWTERLGEVADACPVFRRLARCWPELTKLHETGDTDLLTAVIKDLRGLDAPPIRMTVRRHWPMSDARPSNMLLSIYYGGFRLPPGTHDMERIIDPFNPDGYRLVLKGTRLGMSETFWRRYSQLGTESPLHFNEDFIITFDDEPHRQRTLI